jgi:hypothetical protein
MGDLCLATTTPGPEWVRRSAARKARAPERQRRRRGHILTRPALRPDQLIHGCAQILGDHIGDGVDRKIRRLGHAGENEHEF